MLDKLGLDERDADGWRMRRDGGGRLKLRLDKSFPSLQSEALVEGTIQYVRDVGLSIRLNAVAPAEWGGFTRGNKLQIGGPAGWQAGRLPILPDRHWGPLMQTWASTGGREGRAPTDPMLIRLYDLAFASVKLPYLQRGAAYAEMYNILAEEQFIIGVNWGAPLQNALTIVKNNFKNTNAPGYVSRYLNGGFSIIRPEQFFFEGGLNDEGF
jgi:ABC-type transport system substrate-binding protein